MPAALVTGATGFVGRHLIERLAGDGWDVTTLSGRLEQLPPGQFADTAFDAVFHLAAYTPKQSGDVDAAAIVAGNVVGLQSLLAALGEIGRFVFASTLDVYAPVRAGERLTEESPLRPKSLYAASKLFGERLVQDTAAARGFEHTILRYGHLFGPGEDAYAKFVPHTIRNLMKGRPPYVYGDGSSEVDLLYVGDAIEATIRAATVAEPPELVNVVRGESHSLHAVAETLVEIVGFLGAIRFVEDRPQGDDIRFDARRMHEALGTWPLTGLREGLRREVMHVSGITAGR